VVSAASLDRLAGIARQAGALIQAHAARMTAPDLKPDRSPVTAADRAAHALITAALSAWDAGIPAISEEGDIPPYERRRAWSQFWLIDPLDGTKEFLTGSGEYTVNIALVDGNEPVMGVVYAPALDVLYAGAKGLGSWKHMAAGPAERVYSVPSVPGAALVVAESRSHPSADLEAFLTTIRVKRRVQAGSSLKFCWVAEGRADVYPRFGPTMEWDTAAGDVVFRQSGRERERMSPLRYNTPSLRHDRFVIGLAEALS
jgi:3'(2'), 5'-bisphosphate nucleotidase